jgi:hypothetical protein
MIAETATTYNEAHDKIACETVNDRVPDTSES